MQKIPLTVRGAELLKAELQHLKSVARPEVIEAIAEARSHGDLSENAEYEAAKERQGFIEGRIADVENKLSRAHIINPADIHAEGKVVFGATVTLEDLATEEEVCYQIVGEDEADIKQNKISIGSPIARALIGKVEGDVAEVQAPGGVREYDIVAVHCPAHHQMPQYPAYLVSLLLQPCHGTSVHTKSPSYPLPVALPKAVFPVLPFLLLHHRRYPNGKYRLAQPRPFYPAATLPPHTPRQPLGS